MKDYECSYCKYKISDIEMESFKFDYGCPRCKRSFLKFKYILCTK